MASKPKLTPADKPKPPTAPAQPKYIDVDMLDMEFQKGLPNWLDPMLKYSGKFDEDRRDRQRVRTMKLQHAARKKKRK